MGASLAVLQRLICRRTSASNQTGRRGIILKLGCELWLNKLCQLGEQKSDTPSALHPSSPKIFLFARRMKLAGRGCRNFFFFFEGLGVFLVFFVSPSLTEKDKQKRIAKIIRNRIRPVAFRRPTVSSRKEFWKNVRGESFSRVTWFFFLIFFFSSF